MIAIDAMSIQDYDAAVQLWSATPELGVSLAFDTHERLAAYLARNPGLSTAARAGEQLIGTVLCGHDGRRGSLFHMVVAPAYRNQGIARRMVARALSGLKAEGISSAFVFVATGNPVAAAFWGSIGWQLIPQINYYYAAF